MIDLAQGHDRQPYFTFHSCTPIDTFACACNSTRSAVVVTGLNFTRLYLLRSTPNGPAASTCFHCSPSLYNSFHDAGTRTPPWPVSSNQYNWLSDTVAAFSNVISTHSALPFF